MEHDEERNSTEGLEITPEMIEAGVKILCGAFDQPADFLVEHYAAEVYRAMARLAP